MIWCGLSGSRMDLTEPRFILGGSALRINSQIRRREIPEGDQFHVAVPAAPARNLSIGRPNDLARSGNSLFSQDFRKTRHVVRLLLRLREGASVPIAPVKGSAAGGPRRPGGPIPHREERRR